MLPRPTTAPPPDIARLAPEPHFSAYHHLIYKVAIFMRSRPQITGDQWFALGDALHNIPEFLTRHDGWREFAARDGTSAEAEFRRLFLEPYDRDWVKSTRTSVCSGRSTKVTGASQKPGLGRSPRPA